MLLEAVTSCAKRAWGVETWPCHEVTAFVGAFHRFTLYRSEPLPRGPVHRL